MKKIIMIACCLLPFYTVQAQITKDPSHWTTGVKFVNGAYDLVFTVQLDSGWHVWALDPGGDGTLIAPAFTFDKKSADFTLVGKPDERGNIIEESMTGIDGKVRYFRKKAEFFQVVKAAHGQKIKGTYSYQLCNNMMCLPPKTVAFELRIP